MLTLALGALAVFALAASAVLALASHRRVATAGVGCAIALALTAAAFAVIGQRQRESCVARAERLAPDTSDPFADVLMEAENLKAQREYMNALGRCESPTLGIYDPF